MTVLIHDIAHARSGDKGNTSNVAVMAYDAAGYALLRTQLTAERMMAAYAHLAEGPIERYEVPKLLALNFVIHKALAGGVTRSLRLDPHGKTFSSIVLGIELPG